MTSISSVTDIVHAYLQEQKLAEQFTLVETTEAVDEIPLTLCFDANLSHIQVHTDYLKNNSHVRNKIRTLYAIKETLDKADIIATVEIRNISLKGGLVSARSLLGCSEQSKNKFLIPQNLLERIQSVNFNHTHVSSLGLEKVYSLKSLTKLKLDFCKNITEILVPEVVCPSLVHLSLVGTTIQLSGSWQKRLEKKFPNITCIDVTLGKPKQKSPGLYDIVTLSTCVDARMYYPCGHLFGQASRIHSLAPCGMCKSPIESVYHVTKHITRFEKKENTLWQSTVVDIKRKPLQEGNIYFHAPCQQFFNRDTVIKLYGEQILNELQTTDASCIGCLRQEQETTLRGLFKAYPVLTEKNAEEKSQNLPRFADSRYIEADR